MKIKNSHERIVAATPVRVTALIANFDRVWPTQIAPPGCRGAVYTAPGRCSGKIGPPGCRAGSGWSGRMSCTASTGSSWSLPRTRRFFAIRWRAARPGSTRRSGVSGSGHLTDRKSHRVIGPRVSGRLPAAGVSMGLVLRAGRKRCRTFRPGRPGPPGRAGSCCRRRVQGHRGGRRAR
jgi:hypothetical protein